MNILMHSQTKREIDNFTSSVGHALALTGEQGSGKGFIALYIAATILNTDMAKISSHPYVKMIDASRSGSGIDEVRSVHSFLNLKVPGTGNTKRAVIIENSDSFGHEAQNALLKTLEEPPADTVIIITFSRVDMVLPTIHSRVRNIKVRPVAADDAIEYFARTATKEEVIRAHHMSSGQAGLMTAVLNGEVDHPLVKAIEIARELIGMSRYERLSKVDKLSKDKEISPTVLVDGMFRLLHAGYKHSVITKPASQLKPVVARLKLVGDAYSDLQNNVQSKLVLSRLFSEL